MHAYQYAVSTAILAPSPSLSLLQIPEGRVRGGGGVCVGRNDRPTVTGGAGERQFLGAMSLPRGLLLCPGL